MRPARRGVRERASFDLDRPVRLEALELLALLLRPDVRLVERRGLGRARAALELEDVGELLEDLALLCARNEAAVREAERVEVGLRAGEAAECVIRARLREVVHPAEEVR